MKPESVISDGDLPVLCPHCNERFAVSLAASIPKEQRLVMTLEHISPFIAAETLGETITNTAKLLVSVAEGIGGKTAVMVESCELTKGKAKITFVVIDVKAEESP